MCDVSEDDDDDDDDDGGDCFSFRTRVLHTTHLSGKQRWVTATWSVMEI